MVIETNRYLFTDIYKYLRRAASRKTLDNTTIGRLAMYIVVREKEHFEKRSLSYILRKLACIIYKLTSRRYIYKNRLWGPHMHITTYVTLKKGFKFV